MYLKSKPYDRNDGMNIQELSLSMWLKSKDPFFSSKAEPRTSLLITNVPKTPEYDETTISRLFESLVFDCLFLFRVRPNAVAAKPLLVSGFALSVRRSNLLLNVAVI